MTRINLGIPPEVLTRQHLLAEAREIKRIPNMVRQNRVKMDIPPIFSLGKGHVRFFYDKLGFLLKRYLSLYAECLRRGYNVQDYSSAWAGVPETLMGDYIPRKTDVTIIKKRLIEKDGEYRKVFSTERP